MMSGLSKLMQRRPSAVGTGDNRFLDAIDAPKEIIRFLYFADRRAEICDLC
jgi:hypothetical protein